MAADPRQSVIQYPGGIRVRFRWAGSGEGKGVFALSEAGGRLSEFGDLVDRNFEALCRAELRVEPPGEPWAARLASPIFADPAAIYWDTESLLVVAYGFVTYAFEARTGDLRWRHRSGSPAFALFGSSRLPHLLVQSEIETFAIERDGAVAWRLGHSDVVVAAELVGGRLVLTSFDGQVSALDPSTGRPAA
jgi:outer membrane protein assembly factor BamB